MAVDARELSPEEIRDVNARYHDVAAADYDAKWGIDFGDVGRSQVLMKVRKLLGPEIGRGGAGGIRFSDALEIGAGTGYFTLNLMRAGVIERATCTDISEGMLATLAANARRLRLEVDAQVADAERLPFAGERFDLVLGHAILHHVPDLAAAFAEIHRVLRPGGTFLFAGEPSRTGDRLAAYPKRGAAAVAPLWRAAIGARPSGGHAADDGDGHAHDADDHLLEGVVDVHAFAPGELEALARDAGFEGVRVRGEELLANWFGWANRTLEATARPDDVPWLWRQYAYRGYLALQWLDAALLESRLPAGVFYNLMITGTKPTTAERATA
ncbi:MAG TPA: class I SAM-dependent methyltransferase [Solirubrobacteraceae bacterium]|jgi:SAM-dependent methyltransferase|nr:class I SAM-dependent methyltransferase [Solirubrobacteraceae bacterium]